MEADKQTNLDKGMRLTKLLFEHFPAKFIINK